MPRLIADPALQLVQPVAYPGKAGGLAFGGGAGGGRAGSGPLLPFRLFRLSGGPLTAGLQPLLHPFRALRRAERRGVLHTQKQQGERVLAGNLAAGAGAGTDRPGLSGHVHPDLVRFGSAPLTRAPHDSVVKAERRPCAGRDKPPRRPDRGVVRGHADNGVNSDIHDVFPYARSARRHDTP